MKKIIGILACFLLTSICLVSAFDLVEGYRLDSINRQECRIDDDWLVVENTNSHLNGYLTYYPLLDDGTGYINVYYYGHTTLGKEKSVYAFVEIDNVFQGLYGKYFTGKVDYFPLRINDEISYCYNVEVNGFFCDTGICQGQTYITFEQSTKSKEVLGETWATFLQ